MNIPDKNFVIDTLSKTFECTFSPFKGKQIMYHGLKGTNKIVLCTPSSKIHVQGHGWFDLTAIQVKLLDEADISILAIRLEGNKIYYLNFEELRKLMTSDNIHVNLREGEHWKFYVWDDHIHVRGNKQKFMINPTILPR